MSAETAIRITEILLGFSLLLQAQEHLRIPQDHRRIHITRLILAFAMILASSFYIPLLLFISGIYLLQKYQGPYNGGADRMTLLILLCLTIYHLASDSRIQNLALAYLAAQTLLSYFRAGWAKAMNKDWWSGLALQKILKSHYVSGPPKYDFQSTFRVLGPAIIFLELLLPFFVFSWQLLPLALLLAFIFHGVNAYVLGLNRFLWVWVSAYPAVLWLLDFHPNS